MTNYSMVESVASCMPTNTLFMTMHNHPIAHACYVQKGPTGNMQALMTSMDYDAPYGCTHMFTKARTMNAL